VKMSTDELNALHRKLDAIHVAVVGDPSMGHQGLVARVAAIESEVKDHDQKFVKWGGVFLGIGLALEFVRSKILGG